MILLLTLAAITSCAKPRPHLTELGIWYWHSPFSISPEERKQLTAIGVTKLFVRAATFTTDGKRVLATLPQTWQSNGDGLPVVLVFNFDAGLDSHFGELPLSLIVGSVANGIAGELAIAEKHGLKADGVQMDIDCPTRLLPKYADLLHQVKSQLTSQKTLRPGMSFSATALQTWLTSSSGYSALADACDYLAPQFYEGSVGRRVDQVQPLADEQNLARGIQRAESFGKPFYVGIAAYGHALVYDRKGDLVGMYHGMTPSEAVRHPALKPLPERLIPERTQDEELLRLQAVHPDLNGRGLGDTIAYVIPTPAMLESEIKTLREAAGSNCQGITIYRYPGEGDEMALPLTTVAAVAKGEHVSLGVAARVSVQSAPWALIGGESHAKFPPKQFRVRLTDGGTSGSSISPDGIEVMMSFSGIGLDSADAGDFDHCLTGRLEGGQFTACAPPHANAVFLRRSHLFPGQTILSGDVATPADGPQLTNVHWKVQGPAGVMNESGDASIPKDPK